jgi:hypothetical protein
MALPLDISGCFDGYRLWLDGHQIGPTHPTLSDAARAKAAVKSLASDATAQLASCLAMAPSRREA